MIPQGARLCFSYLTKAGCPAGASCAHAHVSMKAKALADRCKQSAILRAVFRMKGEAITRDVRAASTRGMDKANPQQQPSQPPSPAADRPPSHGRKRVGAASGTSAPSVSAVEDIYADSDADQEEESAADGGSGGRASGVGAMSIQVPVGAYVSHFYPKMVPTPVEEEGPIQRVSTIHPDAPTRPFPSDQPSATDLLRFTHPSTTRVGRALFSVRPPASDGTFQGHLGPVALEGFEAGQRVMVMGKEVDNACVVKTFAHILGEDTNKPHSAAGDAMYEELLVVVYDAIASLGPPAQREQRTTSLVRMMAHDVAMYAEGGHALDAFIFLYFPPAALDTARVMMVQYQSGTSEVAIDILQGQHVTDDSPWRMCLQRRGHPGHLQPLKSITAAEGASLLAWADHHAVPVRRFTASGWRHLIASDLHGASISWQPPPQCDVCSKPAAPLPPCPL